MKFEIKRHKNGFVLTKEDEVDGLVYQETETEEGEPEAFAAFLWLLIDEYGPQECKSRYSPKRLHVEIRPGDKCESSLRKRRA